MLYPDLTEKYLNKTNILRHIGIISEANYGDEDISLIEEVLADVVDLYEGKRQGYQACDTAYHNLFHIFQTIPPFVEMIDGWNRQGASPRISKKYFTLGTIGALLHDTGYIKTEGDDEGTGAKYTFTHIERSTEFAVIYLPEIGLNGHDINSILNILRCTGIILDVEISFNNDQERIVGYALGTADLLGQMSADDYPEKLPVLYKEFAEANCYRGLDTTDNISSAMPASPQDLMRNTPSFYKTIAMARFKMMGSLYSYIPYHYGSSENPYLVAIERNIETILENLKNKTQAQH